MDIAILKQKFQTKIQDNLDENTLLNAALGVLDGTFLVEFVNLDALTTERDGLTTQKADLEKAMEISAVELKAKDDRIIELEEIVIDLRKKAEDIPPKEDEPVEVAEVADIT